MNDLILLLDLVQFSVKAYFVNWINITHDGVLFCIFFRFLTRFLCGLKEFILILRKHGSGLDDDNICNNFFWFYGG